MLDDVVAARVEPNIRAVAADAPGDVGVYLERPELSMPWR
jgi:hypothetical protein